MVWRAPFRPLVRVPSTAIGARRKGHAIAHSPRPASAKLRRPVGYLALSLPGESVLPGVLVVGMREVKKWPLFVFLKPNSAIEIVMKLSNAIKTRVSG